MKFVSTTAAATAVIAGFLFTLGLAPISALAAPKIEIVDPNFDFGDIQYKDPAEHAFIVKNVGDEVLKISDVRKSCGCTKGDVESREIPAGGQTKLTIAYDTTRKGPFQKTVTVISNDPVTAEAQITFRGNVRTAVEVNPMRVHFGNIYRDDVDANKRQIQISSPDMAKLDVTKVESDNPSITTTLERQPGSENIFNLTVAVAKDAPLGQIQANLKISTNNEKMPFVDVPVFAQIGGDLELNPPRLYFAPKNPGEVQEGTLTIKDRKGKGDLKVVSVVDPAGVLEFTVTAVKEGSEYTILAKTTHLPKEQPTGYFNGTIEVTTNRAGEDKLTIPYNGYIQPPQAEGGPVAPMPDGGKK